MEPQRGGDHNTPQNEALKIFKHNVEAMDLSEADKAVLGRASMKFITYANTGLWIGCLVGCAFPFRKRWGLHLRMFRVEKNPTSGANVVRYYPKLAEPGAGSAAAGAAKDTPPGVPNERLWLLARAMGSGLLGAMIGGQTGAIMGKNAAAKVMENEGTGLKERLKAAMDKTAKELQGLKTSSSSTTTAGARPNSNSGFSGVDYGTSAPASDDYKDDEIASASTSAAPEPSKWEQLRAARAAPPSSWDKLREASSRPSLPASRENEREDLGELKSSAVSDEVAQKEKDKRRKEFDELLERERQGGDDKWNRGRPER